MVVAWITFWSFCHREVCRGGWRWHGAFSGLSVTMSVNFYLPEEAISHEATGGYLHLDGIVQTGRQGCDGWHREAPSACVCDKLLHPVATVSLL